MSNVTFINKNGEVVPDSNEPNEILIQCLEGMLEKARMGEIVGFVGAVADKNRYAEYISAGLIGGFGMIGALDCVRHHLILVARGEEDNPKVM